MSKLQLKNAMDSLQVKKPLRLSSFAPVFQVPLEQTPVAKPTQDENSTEAINATQVDKMTRDSFLNLVEKQTGVRTQTEVINSTPVQNPTQVSKTTQVENPNWVRRKTEQDSSVLLEEQSSEKLEQGYTRVPNAILMRLVSGDLTRNEIKLTLLIARFTISYQRKKAPLSKNVLERMTGLRGAAILEAISGLISKGIVEKEQGDQNRPNLLGLVLPDNWDLPSKKQSQETQATNPTEVGKTTQADFQSSARVQNPTPAPVGNLYPYKDNNKYKNNNSLSETSVQLRQYFKNLQLEKKRESEWEAFESLKKSYSERQINDCVAHVIENGMPRTGEPCHSPLAFLSMGMGQVIDSVTEAHKRASQEMERLRQEEKNSQVQQAEEAQYEAEIQTIEAQFCAAYPDRATQDQVLEQFAALLPFFKPGSAGYRSLAVRHWWKATCEGTNDKSLIFQ